MFLYKRRHRTTWTRANSTKWRSICLHIINIQVLLNYLSNIVSWSIFEGWKHLILSLIFSDFLKGFLNLGIVNVELLLNLYVYTPLSIQLKGYLVLFFCSLSMAVSTFFLLFEHLGNNNIFGNQRMTTHSPSQHQTINNQFQFLCCSLDCVIINCWKRWKTSSPSSFFIQTSYFLGCKTFFFMYFVIVSRLQGSK